LEHLLMVADGQEDRPAVQAVGTAWRQPDGIDARVVRYRYFDTGNAVHSWTRKMNLYLAAAPGSHRQGGRRTGEVADPQPVPKISTAAPHRVAHFHQVIAPILEGVGQPGISLQAGRIIIMASR